MRSDLIEKAYSFLWEICADSIAGRGSTLGFRFDYITDSRVNLFYGSNAFSADPPVPGYGAGTAEKSKKKQSVSFPDTDRFDGKPVFGMGNLVGAVAAISAGGAVRFSGMWVTANYRSFINSFIEATLVQLFIKKRSAVRRLPR